MQADYDETVLDVRLSARDIALTGTFLSALTETRTLKPEHRLAVGPSAAVLATRSILVVIQLELPTKTRGKRDSTSDCGKFVATPCIETAENDPLTAWMDVCPIPLDDAQRDEIRDIIGE